MRIGLLIVAGLALIGFLAVAVVLPNMQGAGQSIKVASRNDPKHGDMKWIVSDNGVIHGWNEKNAIEITLMPSLQAGKASWNCKGYPVNAMPPNCGGR